MNLIYLLNIEQPIWSIILAVITLLVGTIYRDSDKIEHFTTKYRPFIKYIFILLIIVEIITFYPTFSPHLLKFIRRKFLKIIVISKFLGI